MGISRDVLILSLLVWSPEDMLTSEMFILYRLSPENEWTKLAVPGHCTALFAECSSRYLLQLLWKATGC